MSAEPSATPKKPEPSRVGSFIQTYHSFLSTFVIGAAGLIATSIWQYKQSEIARSTAESQQAIAKTQADNSWRIERAEILSKNLEVLASSGEDTAEKRYGALLSLSRGNLIDSELAVSYALELGKENAEYMKSVLSNIPEKNYDRLATAFELTCEQRFGVTRDVDTCKQDVHEPRSAAIADLIEEETEAARKLGKPGPTELLMDERSVQATPSRLAWLFTPYLQTLYERRQWSEIAHFETYSTGARLVSALVLGPARRHELIAASEAADVDKFHDVRVDYLIRYITGPTCDPGCKSRFTDVILTFHGVAMGRFDQALLAILRRPSAEVGSAIGRMHTRLLACQVPPDDLASLRDSVFVPALAEECAKDKPNEKRIEELLSLLVLMPDPRLEPADEQGNAPRNTAEVANWSKTLDRAREVTKEQFKRYYNLRRNAAQANRLNPPATLRKAMFCNAAELVAPDADYNE